MISVRTFSISNEYGETYGLNDIRKGFMQEPSGLGYTMEYSFQKLGSHWIPDYVKDAQKMILGTIVYGTDKPYNAQAQLMEFIRKSKRLVLSRTTSAGTKQIDVIITSYEQTEIKEGNVLECPITMMATSLWYTAINQRAAISPISEDEVRYPIRLPSRFNDHADGSLAIENDGSVEAEFSIEFYGQLANPNISLLQNGVETARIEIEESIDDDERILYSVRGGIDISGGGRTFCYSGSAEDIARFKNTGDTTGLTNLALNFSIENNNFFKLPIGSSQLFITAESVIANPIIVNIYKYYRVP